MPTNIIILCCVCVREGLMCVFLFHSKKKLCALYGKWTECLYVVDPAAFEAHKKNDKKSGEKKSSKAVRAASFRTAGIHISYSSWEQCSLIENIRFLRKID